MPHRHQRVLPKSRATAPAPSHLEPCGFAHRVTSAHIERVRHVEWHRRRHRWNGLASAAALAPPGSRPEHRRSADLHDLRSSGESVALAEPGQMSGRNLPAIGARSASSSTVLYCCVRDITGVARLDHAVFVFAPRRVHLRFKGRAVLLRKRWSRGCHPRTGARHLAGAHRSIHRRSLLRRNFRERCHWALVTDGL